MHIQHSQRYSHPKTTPARNKAKKYMRLDTNDLLNQAKIRSDCSPQANFQYSTTIEHLVHLNEIKAISKHQKDPPHC